MLNISLIVSQQLNDYIFRVALSSAASPQRNFMQDLKFCDTSNMLPPRCSCGLRSFGTLRGVR